MLFDALVVGGGPAGLSAALALARQNMSLVLFDSGVYRNSRADFMHMIPGADHVAPSEFRATSRQQLTRYEGVTITNTNLIKAQKTSDGLFQVGNSDGSSWQGRKLILAAGALEQVPDIPGYDSVWGRGIYQCLFCKGYEQRGASAAVFAQGMLANSGHAMHIARMAAALSASVTIYTQGNKDLEAEIICLIASGSAAGSAVMKTDNRIIKQFEAADNKAVTVELEDGSRITHDYVSHQPPIAHQTSLADQLGLEKSEGGEIVVSSPFQQTSVRGVFAAGDLTSMLKSAPNAVYTGNLAGAMASMQILTDRFGQAPLFPPLA